MSVEAIVIQAGQGKALSLRGTQVAYKADGQRPAGGPTFLEFTAAPGFNTGDHIQNRLLQLMEATRGLDLDSDGIARLPPEPGRTAGSTATSSSSPA
jgi:hypothetical protein